MPLMVERTLFKVGEDSFAVTLPKAWVSYKKLKHGDIVEIIVDDDILIRTKARAKETARDKS
jgi:antitoxin component of MazEF toxin-antitoxin module